MDGGGFSKAGSPEDQQAGARRAQYHHECSFCKRGFTNAQALGGHMNLHRKDRGGGGKSARGGAAPPATPHDGGAGGSRQYGGGDQVHMGLALGRNEDVDLELRLGQYH